MGKAQLTIDMAALTTLADWLHVAESALANADLVYGHGTDNPWDEAVAIARYVLRLPIDADLNVAQAHLTDDEKQRLTILLHTRLTERIPVAYLTQQAWFAGLSFFVDQRVLIPRSPLAELIEARFAPWITTNVIHDIADIGTGSGCIAIACAQAFPAAAIDAVDIDQSALDVAAINCRTHQVTERVQLYQGDLFSPLTERRYDVIISNPPYVDQQDMQTLPIEYTHEPALGLVAGNDGLAIVVRLLATAIDHINDNGILIVEVGNSAGALQHLFPMIDFVWLEFECGGDGVFLLTATQLSQFRNTFKAALTMRHD